MTKRSQELPCGAPRYQVVRELGSGGGGCVLLARDRLQEQREVALKIGHDGVAPDDVRGEFRVLRDLRHPAIARAFDLGRLAEGGRAYFTMEYVGAPTLETHAKALRSRLESGDAAPLVLVLRQLCSALSYLHERGLLHLDLKPRNVVLAEKGLKLIDFGLFQGAAQQDSRRAKGTRRYSAPEIENDLRFDHRADLYSLGAVLHGILYGDPPESGGSPATGSPQRDGAADEGRVEAFSKLADVSRRLLEPAASRRFQTAAEVDVVLAELCPRSSPFAAAGDALGALDFCGRRGELDDFFSWLHSFRTGAGGGAVCEIHGELGSGKSRFIEACVTELLCRGVQVVEAASYASVRQQGLRSLVERAAILYRGEGTPQRNFPFLFTHLGLRRHRSSATELAHLPVEEIRARVFRELMELCAGLEQSLVLVVDDVDPGDADLVDALERLARRSASPGSLQKVGALISRSARAALPWSDQGLAKRALELGPIDVEDLQHVLRRLEGCFDARTLRRLAVRSQGNPGLLVQLLYQERVHDGGGDDLAGIEELVLERLGALGEAERSVVLFLSLAAAPLRTGKLSTLLELPGQRIREALDRLERAGVVARSAQGAYLLRVISGPRLVREYGDAVVRSAHRGLGAFLRSRNGHAAAAAVHLLAGGDSTGGLELARVATAEFRLAGRVLEAMELCRKCVEGAQDAAGRREFLEQLGDFSEKAGAFDSSREVYEQALSCGDLPVGQKRRLLRKLAGIYHRAGRLEDAERTFRQALDIAEAAEEDVVEQLALFYELASFHLFRDEFPQATAYANRGLEILDRAGTTLDDESCSVHTMQLRSVAGHILLRQFDYDGAARELRDSLKVSQRLGSLASSAQILNNLGVAYYQGNRLAEALRVYGRAEKFSDRTGNTTALFSIQCNRAAIHARRGELGVARGILESVRRMPHAEVSERGRLFLRYTEGLVARLELTDACDVWRECIELADRLPDPVLGRYGRVYSAENEIHQGRWGRAREILDELGKLGADSGPLQQAVDARRAYLDAVCGVDPGRLAALESVPPTSVRPQRIPYARVWDWVYCALALLEAERFVESRRWLERARSFFVRLRQYPGALECELALADLFLRRGHTRAAAKRLAQVEPLLEKHDVPEGARAAPLRVAILRARLALQQDDGLDVIAQHTDEARRRLTTSGGLESAWLIEWIAVEAGLAPSTVCRDDALERFVTVMRPEDRSTHQTRNPLVRFGLRVETTARGRRAEFAALRDARRRLRVLSTLRAIQHPDRALGHILDACGSAAGALVLESVDGAEASRRCLAFRGADARSRFLAAPCELADASTLRVDVGAPGQPVLGALLLDLSPGVADDVKEFLEVAALCLLPLFSAYTAADLADSLTTPLLVEGGETTRSLARGSSMSSQSPQWAEMLALLRRTRESDLPILLTGESGVGKDRVARWIHTLSARRDGPFVTVDCSSVPDGLWESELFGFERGAFTGADKAKRGVLLQASRGTVYFDHIDAAALDVQTKLLRVIEEKTVRPVGAEEELPIDVRWIASSQQDLRELCERGEFRSDLYFRLCGISLTLPALRERAEDIPDLVAHFCGQLPDGGVEFAPDALEALREHHWPGNVRELESLVRRLALTAEGAIQGADVVRALGKRGGRAGFPRWVFEGKTFSELLDLVKREQLLYLFDRCDGDVARIAEELGTTTRNVYQRFRQAGLRLGDLREGEA